MWPYQMYLLFYVPVFTLTFISDICEGQQWVCERPSQRADVQRVYIWSCVWHRLFLGRARSSPAEINDLNKLPAKAAHTVILIGTHTLTHTQYLQALWACNHIVASTQDY